jgi:hypothetical protein
MYFGTAVDLPAQLAEVRSKAQVRSSRSESGYDL